MQAVRQWLREARSIAVLTGAGVSAESGVPTFRGENGLWRQYRAENLATPEAFERDPKLVWEWYDWRRSLIARAEPNPGHYALAQAAGPDYHRAPDALRQNSKVSPDIFDPVVSSA
jgi:NAD-dependent deacetylase